MAPARKIVDRGAFKNYILTLLKELEQIQRDKASNSWRRGIKSSRVNMAILEILCKKFFANNYIGIS